MRELSCTARKYSICDRASVISVIRESTDRFGVNCRQQGLMESHALVTRLVRFIRSRLGFHSCCTSLLCLLALRTEESEARVIYGRTLTLTADLDLPDGGRDTTVWLLRKADWARIGRSWRASADSPECALPSVRGYWGGEGCRLRNVVLQVYVCAQRSCYVGERSGLFFIP
jgi:hypothetical protein